MGKLDFSKPDQLQTRDGRLVRIYATDGCGAYRVHGAVKTEVGWLQLRWDDEGMCQVGSAVSNDDDLIAKPVRITGWMNVYPDGVTGNVSADRGECKKHTGTKCLGQIYIDAEIQE